MISQRMLTILVGASALLVCATPGCGSSDEGTGSTTGTTHPPQCGNGKIEGDEECDDANADDTDDCLSTCVSARCGDGYVHAGAEDCDDSNTDNTDACISGCVAAVCGDGFVQAGVEACDDGNQDDTDGCKNDCTMGSGCGNGKVEAGEECDDGNASNADACLTTCLTAVCGDGFAQIGVEECDDGNQDDTDNCKNDCTLNMMGTFSCPGSPVVVSIGADALVQGDTSLATNLYHGSCGGSAASEIVYEVKPTADGVLSVQLDSAGMIDPVLYVRDGDCELGAEFGCSDFAIGPSSEALVLPVQANISYWVFADGFDNTSGLFALSFHLATDVPGDKCPGVPVALDPNNDVQLVGNTAAATTNYKGSGACAPSAATKDVVYAVTPSQDGNITVTLDPTYDAILYARSGACATGGTQIACAQAAGVGGLENITFAGKANTVYYVFVDGNAGDAGMYNVSFHLQ
jgi:cysteine-rich repeat protein